MQLVRPHEGPEVHLLRRAGELLDLGLILLVLLQLFLKAALPLCDIEAVVAAVELRLPVGDLNAALHHTIQEPAVVADGQHRALVVQIVILQPLRGPQIQVVGRLVQQQDIRVLQDEAPQVYPGLLPAGEGGKELLPLGRRDLQAVCHPVAVDLHAVAAKAPVVVGEQGGGAVVLHELGELLHAAAHVGKPRLGGTQHVLYRPVRGEHRNLGDEADAPPRGDADLPLVIIQRAGENAEERGLAAAVGAKNAHPLPGIHGKGEPVQNVIADLKGLYETGYGDFSHIRYLL